MAAPLTGKALIGSEKTSLFSRPGSRGRVGIIINGFHSAYYGQMVEGASDYLMAGGYQTIVQSNLGSRMGEMLACSSLKELDCDGLIIHADAMSNEELIDIFNRYENTVLLNRYLKPFAKQCVYSDNVIGGALAARCLLDNGHENIAMICGPERFFEACERAQGFNDELAKDDRHVLLTEQGDFHQDSGTTAMQSVLDSGLDITAVFTHNDEMAFGAMDCCRQRGIRIPEDISIIGYDGLFMCDYVAPKLTTVQQPLHQMGTQAGRLLADLLAGKTNNQASDSNLYAPVLAERESVAPPTGYTRDNIVLTKRETQCLTWTACGKTAWEISVILGISESTSTFHLRNAVVKLKACNRTNAVAKAMHLGLVTLD